MNKLKPCPQCGKSGSAVHIKRIMFSGSIFDKHLYYVICGHCNFCGKTKVFLWRAVKAWNRRANDENIL